MTYPMHTSSIPVFRQMLGALKDVLAKTEAHATARKIEPDALLQARLYPDMFPMARQVLIACDFAKGVCARLAGVEVPSFPDYERPSFVELNGRFDAVPAVIESLPAENFAEAATRQLGDWLQRAERIAIYPALDDHAANQPSIQGRVLAFTLPGGTQTLMLEFQPAEEAGEPAEMRQALKAGLGIQNLEHRHASVQSP